MITLGSWFFTALIPLRRSGADDEGSQPMPRESREESIRSLQLPSADPLGRMEELRDIARSERFSPVLPDESQVNPGVYGAELAFWLCAELAALGVITSYPVSEDWGGSSSTRRLAAPSSPCTVAMCRGRRASGSSHCVASGANFSAGTSRLTPRLTPLWPASRRC